MTSLIRTHTHGPDTWAWSPSKSCRTKPRKSTYITPFKPLQPQLCTYNQWPLPCLSQGWAGNETGRVENCPYWLSSPTLNIKSNPSLTQLTDSKELKMENTSESKGCFSQELALDILPAPNRTHISVQSFHMCSDKAIGALCWHTQLELMGFTNNY